MHTDSSTGAMSQLSDTAPDDASSETHRHVSRNWQLSHLGGYLLKYYSPHEMTFKQLTARLKFNLLIIHILTRSRIVIFRYVLFVSTVSCVSPMLRDSKTHKLPVYPLFLKRLLGILLLCVTMPGSPVDAENGTPEKEKGSVTDPGPLVQSFRVQLDTGNEYLNVRQKFWQIWCVTTASA